MLRLLLILSLCFIGCDDGGSGDAGANSTPTGGSDETDGPDTGAAGETGMGGSGGEGMGGDEPPMGGTAGEPSGMGGEGGAGPDEPFVDPDEGEPQPYMTPAALSEEPNVADPGQSAGCGASTVSLVRGWVVDRIGRPIADAMAQVCIGLEDEPGSCLMPENTNAEGVFTVVVPESERCISKATFRIIKPSSGRAPMYCKIDLSSSAQDTRLTVIDPYVMYAGVPAVDLPPEDDFMAARTVTFATGFELDVIPFDLVSPYEELGMRKVGTDERGLCFFDDDSTIPDHLYAFTPDSSIYGDAGAPFRMPNEDGLAPGTVVDTFILGGLGCEVNGAHLAEGAWRPLGTATVSEDGTKIVSDEGAGLTCLTWMGYKAR